MIQNNLFTNDTQLRNTSQYIIFVGLYLIPQLKDYKSKRDRPYIFFQILDPNQ